MWALTVGSPSVPKPPQAAALTLSQRERPTLSGAFFRHGVLADRGAAGPQEAGGARQGHNGPAEPSRGSGSPEIGWTRLQKAPGSLAARRRSTKPAVVPRFLLPLPCRRRPQGRCADQGRRVFPGRLSLSLICVPLGTQ